jgi:4-hydroxybenzoate polyprenyltransferase
MAKALIKTLRVKQWIKNLFVLLALIFTKNYTDSVLTGKAVSGFLLFCFLSSSVYLLNDVLDIEADRKHPIKKRRPIPAGEISIGFALTLAVVLCVFSLVMSYALLGDLFLLIAVIYTVLNLLYTIVLKHVVIVDVLIIAIGFVLRAMAGAAAINVEISNWLLLCTILLSLFLALSKRRHELVLLDEGAQGHRLILKEYSPYLLDQLIGVVTASTLMAYALYTMDAEVQENLGTDKLVFTTPFVIYGIFRYLYLVHKKDQGGDTSEMIVTDRPFALNIVLWGLSVLILLSWKI